MAGSFLPHTLAFHTVWLFRLYLAICFRSPLRGDFNDLTVQLLRYWGFCLVWFGFFCWSLSWVWIREERVAAGQEMYNKEDPLEKKMAMVGCGGFLVDEIWNPKSRKSRGFLRGAKYSGIPSWKGEAQTTTTRRQDHRESFISPNGERGHRSYSQSNAFLTERKHVFTGGVYTCLYRRSLYGGGA